MMMIFFLTMMDNDTPFFKHVYFYEFIFLEMNASNDSIFYFFL